MISIRDGMQALPQHFSWRLARTDADLRAAFELRYRVYCQELRWESPADCIGGFERDAFDGHSQHALMIHHATGAVAACVRVVFADPCRPALALPFERGIGGFAPPVELAGALARRGNLCEFSRFAVAAEFRRRLGDGAAPLGWPGCEPADRRNAADRRSTEPMVIFGLVLAAAALFLESGTGFAYALMAESLGRLIERCGFPFRRLAGPFEHRGPRVLYLIASADVLRSADEQALILLAAVHAQLYGGAARRAPLLSMPAGTVQRAARAAS